MEAMLVYQDYFLKKKKVIENLLNCFKQKGKKVAVWGAGLRGQAFLQSYDHQCRNIAYVYDIDEKRYGSILETGHEIVNYKEHTADIILVMNCLYEMDIRETLKKESINASVINIDTLILGNLQVEDVLAPGRLDLQPVRNIKIAALTILYHPTDKTIQNLYSYAGQFGKLYIYDNTETVDRNIRDEISLLKNAVYFSEEQNKGLSKAINQVCKLAIKEGFHWLITFDQDSRPSGDMIKQMVDFANSSMCNDSVGLIAPNILGKEIIRYDTYYTYFDKVFQSGAMHSLKVYDMVGGYDENLFIDQVDYEYCVRMRLYGYKIIKINNAYLEHNLDDDSVQIEWHEGHKIYINKYSPMRYYHILKNNLYLYDKYQDRDKIYALECENNIRNIKKNAKYDNHRDENERALQQAEIDFSGQRKHEEKNVMTKDDIIDYYAEDYKIESYSYKMMGKMLEKENVAMRLKKFNLQKIYIYGGGYLGVQLYFSLKNTNIVQGIVDKSGGISVDISESIPAFTVEQLVERYKDETIIITPIRYYSQIQNSLANIIPEDKILFLGEFLEGVV